MYTIIDTFDDFMRCWETAQRRPIAKQIRLWRASYMARFPELLDKQLRNYEDEGFDWRRIARDRVFPHLRERLPLMREAHRHLPAVCEWAYGRARKRLKIDFDVNFVIYVGIGCGAGWATRYSGRPACLLGLEMIADCGWQSRERLRGLVAHEIAHLAHMAWRRQWDRFIKAERQPLFHLYSEGFGQRGEHIILGRDGWHEAQDRHWLPWCRRHKAWLAREYLRRVAVRASINDFFGSWLDIKGIKSTGHFLGHEFIRWLGKKRDMKEIATLSVNAVKCLATEYLRSVAE